MKKSNIAKSIAALSVITMIGGGIVAAQASNENGNNLFGGRGKGKNIEKRTELTAEQIADRQAKMDAVRTALDNKDYNAWVAAVTAMDANSPQLKTITADNFSEYAAKHEERTAEITEQTTKIEAVKTALANSDYTAWMTAVTALDSDSPLLEKITLSNFASYVKAHELREQADTIMKELGIENEGMGMGLGIGMGGHEKGNRDGMEMGMIGLGEKRGQTANLEK